MAFMKVSLILGCILIVAVATDYGLYGEDMGLGYGGGGGGSLYSKHEIKYPPQPYGFGYDIKDHYGNNQFRKEYSDGKKVTGSYGYTDAHGIHRMVDYIADEFGFRAKVRTNEPGTANENPAHVSMQSTAIQGLGGGYH